MIPADHRDLPPPTRPWVLAQSWRELLFAHWSFPAAEVRALLPPGLMLDTHGGRAWIGVVPFRMAGVHPRWLPGVPGASRFPELNVRTYVTVGELRGVYFFSLDAASRLAVAAARAWFALPYHFARMHVRRDGDTQHYRSERAHAEPGAEPPRFDADFAPTGPEFHAARGSLEHWLTERYLLFSVARDGRVLRGDVHHAPWPLRPARAEIRANTMLAPMGLDASRAPESLLYAERVDVQTWAPRTAYRPVSSGARG